MKNGVLSILGILILALLLGSCATTPKAAIVKEGIVGHWEGDWGSMYFKVVGGKIRGVYTHDEGRKYSARQSGLSPRKRGCRPGGLCT
jgi:hypothetical protein